MKGWTTEEERVINRAGRSHHVQTRPFIPPRLSLSPSPPLSLLKTSERMTSSSRHSLPFFLLPHGYHGNTVHSWAKAERTSVCLGEKRPLQVPVWLRSLCSLFPLINPLIVLFTWNTQMYILILMYLIYLKYWKIWSSTFYKWSFFWHTSWVIQTIQKNDV